MTVDTAILVTKCLVWSTPVVWLAWDLFAYLRYGRDATESHYLWSVYRRHHWFALVLGIAAVVLMWHFFAE